MSPRFAALRAEMTVDEAIHYLRRKARDGVETIYTAYVLDGDQRLVGVVSFRELFSAQASAPVRDVMRPAITVTEDLDQEHVARIIAEHNLLAVPVVDAAGRMKGIVTVDDVVDVVNEEATEDIQKLGGMEALDDSYMNTSFFSLLRKRAGWLAVLFVGEMLTASAMSVFQDEIAKAVVLALFVPLIISSGGNSGSQASSLIMRAIALGEVHFSDFWTIIRRELFSGLALGCILGAVGVLRIFAWQWLFHSYDHVGLLALTISLALVGVVTAGTLCGAALPLLLKRIGLDPATASTPMVATLVDVTGLVIYFGVASVLLRGTLL
jgi:magnesium transporter